MKYLNFIICLIIGGVLPLFFPEVSFPKSLIISVLGSATYMFIYETVSEYFSYVDDEIDDYF